MVRDEAQRHPVEGLARLLLEHAREDPALLARSQIGVVAGPWPAPRAVPLRAEDVPLQVAASEPDQRELERLVSIAVACARRAEDACHQAQELGWMARRRMSAIAAIAAIAALAVSGSAGSVLLYRADPKAELGAVASAVRDVSDLQQQTAAQLAGISLDLAALRDRPATLPVSSEPETRGVQPAPVATDMAAEAAVSASDRAAPLPPATYVRPHPYPPPPAGYLPADALGPAVGSWHPPPRRSHNISMVSTFVSRLFVHR